MIQGVKRQNSFLLAGNEFCLFTPLTHEEVVIFLGKSTDSECV